jgi:hypothetical protein
LKRAAFFGRLAGAREDGDLLSAIGRLKDPLNRCLKARNRIGDIIQEIAAEAPIIQ